MYFYIGVSVAVIVVVYFLFGRSPAPPKVTIRKDARLIPAAGLKGTGLKKKTKKSEEEDEKVDGLRMTLFYYSQTGTAEDFARRIADDARLYGFHSKVVDVEEYDTDKFKGENHDMVVFCSATYGEGDPPENAVVFHEWLLDESHPEDLLQGTRFAVFGLGDKTYEHFNKMGKVIDKRLEALGAERVAKRGDGDSDANIEEDFLRWKKDFWTEASRVFGVTKTEGKVQRKSRAEFTSKSDAALANIDVDKLPRWRAPVPPAAGPRRRVYDTKNPLLAKIVVNRELHGATSDRSCRHIEIDIGDSINYEAGDHVGIFPVNDLTLVHKLAARIGADLDQVITIYNTEDPLIKAPILGPVTVKAALLYYYEIVLQPRKPMLRVLADYTEDEEERKKLLKLASDDPEDQDYFQQYIQKDDRTIIEVLKDFPGVKPPLDHFLEVMPRQQPRFYSISSSSNVHKGRIHVTAVVVEYKTSCGRVHKGVCTNWLKEQIPQGDVFPVVPVFVRKSSFHLPAQLKNPIMMIGPGTGLAPFRGFLQEREFRAKKNNEENSVMSNDLFFGCRTRDADFLYKEEIEGWVDNKAITQLHLAVSREGPEKVYVQHLMMKPENAQRIWDHLNNNGYVYICGDAKNMSREVNAALRHAIVTVGGKTADEAEKFMENLSARGKYAADVW